MYTIYLHIILLLNILLKCFPICVLSNHNDTREIGMGYEKGRYQAFRSWTTKFNSSRLAVISFLLDTIPKTCVPNISCVFIHSVFFFLINLSLLVLIQWIIHNQPTKILPMITSGHWNYGLIFSLYSSVFPRKLGVLDWATMNLHSSKSLTAL